MFVRFCTVHECDRQTDRRTDGRTLSPYSVRQLHLREAKNVKTNTTNSRTLRKKPEKISMCVDAVATITLTVFGLNHHLIRPYR